LSGERAGRVVLDARELSAEPLPASRRSGLDQEAVLGLHRQALIETKMQSDGPQEALNEAT
jgi:hypothetical protein